MSNTKSITKLSNTLLKILMAALILTPLLDAFCWFYGTITPNQYISFDFPFPISLPFSLTKSLLGFPVILITSAIYMAIIWQLIKLFRLYKIGDVFTQANVSCFKKISNLIIIYPFADIISTTLLGVVLSIGQDDLNCGISIEDSHVSLLVIGIMLRVVSHVMILANEMKEDQELTV